MTLTESEKRAVLSVLKDVGAKRVLDLGCGEGRLLQSLLKEKAFQRIVGVDVSMRALEIAKTRLDIERMPETQRNRIELFQGALTYRDKRFEDFDAACAIEVIEHLELSRLTAFERVVFEYANPPVVVITTPNAEYNSVFTTLPAGQFRHGDHRFEWTRPKFEQWSRSVAERFGYSVRFLGIGDEVQSWGADTNGGVFAMKISVPNLSLVLLVRLRGAGSPRLHGDTSNQPKFYRRISAGASSQITKTINPLHPTRSMSCITSRESAFQQRD